MPKKISLREAVRFHGHLGPYLILGLLAGELALKRLGCGKYFDLTVKVRGANKKPRSCLIDGLQLSTGATYGKGNIRKYNGAELEADFFDKTSGKGLVMRLGTALNKKLSALKSHSECEKYAKELYRGGVNGLRPYILDTAY